MVIFMRDLHFSPIFLIYFSPSKARYFDVAQISLLQDHSTADGRFPVLCGTLYEVIKCEIPGELVLNE